MSIKDVTTTFMLAVALITGGREAQAAAVDFVVPIDWERFDTGNNPADTDAIKSRDLLLTNIKFQLNWFATYAISDGRYVLPAINNAGEVVNREAHAANAIAVSLATGIYDAVVTGVSEAEARARAVRMIRTLAYWNKGTTTTTGSWGDSWQSPISAAQTAQAAWLLWDDLDQNGKNWSARMVEYEADKLKSFEVPYYREDGVIVSPGDSKAEENAWRSTVLQAAIAMMPAHPNVLLWKAKCAELMVSAFSRPSDTSLATVIDGKPVSAWLNGGSNISSNGTLINRSALNPNYMVTVPFNLRSYATFSLAGVPVPESAAFNAAIVYDALVDLEFSGGTIYIDDSEEIYYPEGTDAGEFRFDIYYGYDVAASILGLDTLASTEGLVWERLRATRLQEMQARFSDGRLYMNGDLPDEEWEFEAPSREQTAAFVFANVYLLKWIEAQGELSAVSSWNIGGPIDNDDPEVAYAGTTQTYAHAADIGGTHTVLKSSGASAVITFTGASAKVIGLTAANFGNVKVYVNDVHRQTVDLYSATTTYQHEIFDTGPLPFGVHTIELEALWTKNASATNYYVGFDALTLATVIDDDDSAVVYSGTTQSYANTADVGGAHTVLKSNGATATITFSGSGASVLGLKANNFGDVRIRVDGVYEQTVDLYSPTTSFQQELYDTGALSPGEHTIELEAVWTKNPASSNYYVGFDAVISSE